MPARNSPALLARLVAASPSAVSLVVLFGLLLILAVWGVNIAQVRQDYRETAEVEFTKIRNLAIAHAAYIERLMKEADQLALLLKMQFEQPGAKPDLQQWAAIGVIRTDTFSAVGVLDEHGKMIAGAPGFARINAADRAFFRYHQANDADVLRVGEPILGRVSGKWSVPLTRRVNRPDGSFGGVVDVVIDIDLFTNLFQHFSLGPRDILSVIRSDGTVLARRNGMQSTFGESLGGSQLLDHARRDPVGTYKGPTHLDGVMRFVSYRTLPGYPLIVTVGTAEEDVLAPVRRRERVHYLAAAATTVLVAGCCTLIILALLRQERSARALRRSEDRLRLAKAAAGLGIYDRNYLTGAARWDERMRAIWGFAADEAVSEEMFLGAIHPDDRAPRQAILEQAFASGGGEYSAQYRVINRRDGSVRDVVSNGRVLFQDGRPARMLGTVRDISAEKQLERENQARRLELEMLVKRQVAVQTAAAIAHELNQPLIAVSAYNEAALGMLRSGNLDHARLLQALERSSAQAQRAGDSLHQLMDYLHQGEVAVEPFDLNAVVREALAIVADEGYGGFQTELELQADLPPVLANRVQVEKVLINLLHNSVEAIRGAGLAPGAIGITVRTLAERRVAQVSVRDSGPGMTAELAGRIFDPFFSTKDTGMGLGLAISRALAESNGGQLWYEATEAPGAVFHFTIPLAP